MLASGRSKVWASTAKEVVRVFAYGSNLAPRRLQARVASARPLAIGYLSHRRLKLHKRGRDGSAKADACYTGCRGDRVWGVVVELTKRDKAILDRFESGYCATPVHVQRPTGSIRAWTYLAHATAVDDRLKPFSWYLQFIVSGAKHHRFPTAYVRYLESFESVRDPNRDREKHHQGCCNPNAGYWTM